MESKRANNILYIILALVFVGMTIGSLSTILSAKKLAIEKASPNNIRDSYVASYAGVEVAKFYIETNRITSAGKLPPFFHLNGSLYKISWGKYNSSDSTIEIISRGLVLEGDIMVEKSKIDTTVVIDFNAPAHINPDVYFGESPLFRRIVG